MIDGSTRYKVPRTWKVPSFRWQVVPGIRRRGGLFHGEVHEGEAERSRPRQAAESAKSGGKGKGDAGVGGGARGGGCGGGRGGRGGRRGGGAERTDTTAIIERKENGWQLV